MPSRNPHSRRRRSEATIKAQNAAFDFLIKEAKKGKHFVPFKDIADYVLITKKIKIGGKNPRMGLRSALSKDTRLGPGKRYGEGWSLSTQVIYKVYSAYPQESENTPEKFELLPKPFNVLERVSIVVIASLVLILLGTLLIVKLIH